MAALSPILRSVAGNRLAWWCPGCDEAHQIGYGADPGPRWTWCGDAQRPTFAPSVLVTWDHWVEGVTHRRVCHSFVRQGRIEFLSDSTHPLAGKTVDIPPWPSRAQPSEALSRVGGPR